MDDIKKFDKVQVQRYEQGRWNTIIHRGIALDVNSKFVKVAQIADGRREMDRGESFALDGKLVRVIHQPVIAPHVTVSA